MGIERLKGYPANSRSMTKSEERIHDFAKEVAAIDGVECDPDSDMRSAMNRVTLDFSIGDIDEYRVWDGDREHRAIHRGSLAIGVHENGEYIVPEQADPFYLQVVELSVHLPLYQKNFQEWRDLIDTQDRFSIRDMSGGMTTATPYPTPHIELAVDSCSLDEAKRIIREAANAYEQTEHALAANKEGTLTGLDAGSAAREAGN